MHTRTGKFTIGFRRGWTEWQNDLTTLIGWAQAQGLGCIDLGRDGDVAAKTVVDAGLRVGSVDLKVWEAMISPDRGKRAEAVAHNSEYVRACAAAGTINHFIVMLPEDPSLKRSENFGYMVESFAQLAPVMESVGARLVIEGWPGPGALCCTPEGYRAFFREIPSPAMAINYDGSHLLRQGIDPMRFLREFIDRVAHVHGKDTELMADNLYEYGHEQPGTFAQHYPFGALAWRYTIPGHGAMRWQATMQVLADHGYAGCVSIELEDAGFMGSPELEQEGILQGARFLTGC